MAFDWNSISNKLFNILLGSGYELKLYDEYGKRLVDPENATRFFATFKSQSRGFKKITLLFSLSDNSIDIKTPSINNLDDFDKVMQTKDFIQTAIGDTEGIKINWFKFDSDINLSDEVVNNKIEETIKFDKLSSLLGGNITIVI